MPFIKKNFANRVITNKTFWLLTFSDVFSWGFYVIIAAISGIYLDGKLGDDVVRIVGVGGTIYYFTRGILQIPIGTILDRIKADKDEILTLTVGSVLMGLPFLFYPLISDPIHYYVLQFIFSIGVALNINPWRKLFATNLDTGEEGREYAIYDMINSFFIGTSILLVGYIANISEFYFDAVIVALGVLIMFGGVWSALVFTDKSRKSKDL